jgi:hypothetical protein
MKNYFATNLKHLRTINKDTQQSLTDKITEITKGFDKDKIVKIQKLLNSDFLYIYHSLNNKEKRKFWIEIYDNLGIEALYIDKNRNFVLK